MCLMVISFLSSFLLMHALLKMVPIKEGREGCCSVGACEELHSAAESFKSMLFVGEQW